MATKLFDPHPWNVEDLFKHIYEIPVYQRPYSWDIEQIDTLLSDIYSSFCENKDISYYVGNIILHDKNEKVNGNILKFEVIDGQQRITTFCLFLLAFYCLMGFFSIDETDNTYLDVKNCLWKKLNRIYVSDYQTVTLNSIEKDCLKDLYDYCFTNDNSEFDIVEYCKNYATKNKFEERIIKNFLYIYNYIKNKFCGEPNAFLDFADYIIRNIDFIVIETTAPENKVFTMFESINSKGKKLEEIDLFKTYIFSQLDNSDYKTYLNIWGKLITETEDNLYDYIYNFIKAYICFYRQNIYIQNFKSISRDELISHYKENNVKEALKSFLNDLLAKVKFYKMLLHPEQANDLVKNNKFKFYYFLFCDLNYKHPKPLFMRAFEEYENGKYSSKDELIEIFVEIIKFMIEFLTISKRDSKDIITFFSKVMNTIYIDGKIDVEKLELSIAGELMRENITVGKLKSDITSMDAYFQNKSLAKSLLALYESTSEDENGKFKTSYDQAYLLLKNFYDSFSLDHLLVQTPKKESKEFKYYEDETNKTLVLKEGNDFPQNLVQDGMGYDLFTSLILNKIGNLRIYYKDKNSSRGNLAINLPDYPDFYSYQNISERSQKIANVLFDHILTFPNVDFSKIQFSSSDKDNDNLPKMDELISSGIISVGDELYIKGHLETSKAILLNSKYVNFNGKKMTLNQWGCEVKNWPTINIYRHAAKVGDTETLHDKRLKLISQENN